MPACSFVGAFMNKLAAEINCFRIKRILRHRGIPVKTHFKRRVSCGWFDIPGFARFPISFSKTSPLTFAINPTGIFWIWHYIKTIPASYIMPVVITNTSIDPHICRAVPTSIILHSSHHVVWRFIVNIDMIKLTYRYFFIKIPGLPSVS